MTLIDELKQQPEALSRLVEFYQQNTGLLDLINQFPFRRVLLTGMGASFHAAWIGAYHMNKLGIPAVAVEAADLLNYGAAALEKDTLLVYISQSGSSGEVPFVLESLGKNTSLVSITNNPHSRLATGAKLNLPMQAGDEDLIASKTYLNTLAILWLVARRMVGEFDGSELDSLTTIAGRIGEQLESAELVQHTLLSVLDGRQPLSFLGYGPHAVTARQGAMMLSEWAKIPVLNYSAGAFRHGYIEITEPGCGVIMISPPGQETDPAYVLANELQQYGARLLLIENGIVREPGEPAQQADKLDEYLSPIVDIVPFQIYAEALAFKRGFGKGFRYISKVVTRL